MTALVVAVLAIGATFALNANAIGKRTITACFQSVVLQNLDGTAGYTPAGTDTKTFADGKIITSAIRYLDAQPADVSLLGDANNNTFHCVTLTEATSGDLSAVSQFTIGSVTAKWQVQQIKYDEF